VALYRRATTGETTVIDGSLLASGMWQVQADIMNAAIDGTTPARFGVERYDSPNPLMLPYRTADGRFIALQMLAPDRHWPEFCRLIGHPQMATDGRFADAAARGANRRACIEWLEEVFAGRDYEGWRSVLAGFAGEWAPVQQPHELAEDPQVVANGYLASVDAGHGVPVPVVPVPVQFDGRVGRQSRAPEPGEHTEEVLLDHGLSWAEIGRLKEQGVIL
jgi:crotonobetainyl-CoA:carnitine CoA-transferase CaiB-like acyl-CoA transferase